MKSRRVFYFSLSLFLAIVIILVGIWYTFSKHVSVQQPLVEDQRIEPIGSPTPTPFLVQ